MTRSPMHRRTFVFVGGQQSCARAIDLASLLGAQADPHFVPLLFKHWCFLLSCDQALVGLEEHQRKVQGGSRRLGVLRGSEAHIVQVTAASQGTRPAVASDISPLTTTGI